MASSKPKKKKSGNISRKEKKQIKEVANAIPHLIANQMFHGSSDDSGQDDAGDTPQNNGNGNSSRNSLPSPSTHDPHRGRKVTIIWSVVFACMCVIVGTWVFQMRATWYDISRNEGSEQALAQKISNDFSAIATSFEILNTTSATSTTSTESTTSTNPAQELEALLRAQLEQISNTKPESSTTTATSTPLESATSTTAE